jgi:LuxR family maltose regulon positive regulatory protein
VDRKVTLISAPAGFGKTTLLAEWIASSERCVTWVSLDESDNDPTRFWGVFFAALQKLDSTLAQNAQRLLETAQAPPLETILSAALNDLSACPLSFVHVFDDYHFINNLAVHEALTYLLEHLPPNLHVILASRTDPPLPQARWRGRGELTEVRAADLRFTLDEIAAFLNGPMRLGLLPAQIAALETRTEGWIAGLQMVALSMQGHPDVASFVAGFTGSHRHIIDYLVAEVLQRQPDAIQEFLLDTSILDRLSAPLCDAVTGRLGSQALIGQLDRRNLFLIPLDDERRWYRYHHLFADVLRQRLQQAYPSHGPELHWRASEWFGQNGLEAEAIKYALRGSDWSRAMDLIEGNMAAAQKRGELVTLLRWLGALPDEAIEARPSLGLTHASLLIMVDGFAAADQRLIVAERAWRSKALPAGGEQAALLGQAAAVRTLNALMLEYPGEAILAAGREALKWLPESDLVQRGYVLYLMGCAHYLQLGDMPAAEETFQTALGLARASGDIFSHLQLGTHLSQMRAIRGQLRAAEAAADELMRLAAEPGWEKVPAAALGRMMHGRILYERNDLPGALGVLTTGLAEIEGFALVRAEIIARFLLARVKVALGQAGEARAMLDHAWDRIQKHQLKQLTIPVAAHRARLLLQLGDLETAAQWATTVAWPADGPLNPAWEADHVALARVRLAQGRPAEARQLLARLLPSAEAAGRQARAIEILALQAVAAWAQQDAAEAAAALERALGLAEPEGYVRTFLDEGPPIRALLGQVTAERQAYAQRLLAAFERGGPPVPEPAAGDATRPRPAPTSAASLQPLEPLRERELEVLRLMAEGCSNHEICDRLVLGRATIKTHINRLFHKLDVTSRTQAIARGRALGLLPV